jgi:uncharacterized protein with HEPN domain
MSSHPERFEDYLEHILEALERIQRYTVGKSADEFLTSTLLQDGVLRNLAIIGEVTHRLQLDAPEFALMHTEIPFAKIYATRNRITHAYEEVDMGILWNLVLNDVPALQPKIVTTLNELKNKE